MAKNKDDGRVVNSTANVFAYTEQSHGNHIPGYASLNKHADGSYWLTVRTSGGKETAGVQIPEDQLKAMVEGISAELA